MKRIAALLATTAGVVVALTLSDARRVIGQSVAAEEGYATPRAPTQKVDLNSASFRELQELPGIGQELAKRIVLHRPYRKLDELVARKVLGRKEFARIKVRTRVNSTPERKAAAQRDSDAR
jgi:competence protein ComEA